MKEIEKNSIFYIKNPVKLYFSDIEKICNILACVCKEFTIKTDTYEFDTIEELKNLPDDSISNLEIKAKDPYITIRFYKKTHGEIYINYDNAETRGVFEKINDILKTRRVKLYLIVSVLNKLMTGLFYLSITALLLLLSLKDRNILFPTFIVFGVYISWNILYWAYMYYIKNNYSRIYLHEKNKSFWKRKKDDIILVFISGIVSFIVGFIVAKITK